jgi:hypothetical protein
MNTGRVAEFDTHGTTAVNTVLHDREHPSALRLPIVAGER